MGGYLVAVVSLGRSRFRIGEMSAVIVEGTRGGTAAGLLINCDWAAAEGCRSVAGLADKMNSKKVYSCMLRTRSVSERQLAVVLIVIATRDSSKKATDLRNAD